MRSWSQKSALIQPRTSLGKVQKIDTLKVPDVVRYATAPQLRQLDSSTAKRTRGSHAPEKYLTISFGQPPGISVHGERANFAGLVLGCIEADFCNKILVGIARLRLVGKLSTRSTQYTPLHRSQISFFFVKILLKF